MLEGVITLLNETDVVYMRYLSHIKPVHTDHMLHNLLNVRCGGGFNGTI